MKKTLLHFALLATVAMVMGACQKGPGQEEQKTVEEEQNQQSATQFWDVVGQLVAASDFTPDYKGKTFEPVIGIEDALDKQTRIVPTNSAAAAARSFANLVGVDTIDENTQTYSWSNPEIGTLIYTKTGDSAWAEVKVDIPTVPHLSKIIYRSAEQGDTNASFAGSAYYRFGDVINAGDEVPEYWVCVRPAFDPEGKGETHWMSIGCLPSDNLWHYTGSNKKEYYFPTQLKFSKEHMQNLAEMLYAMCYPTQWEQNILYYSKEGLFGPSGLPIFHDFHQSNVKYNNASFWNNVAVAWRENGIDQLIMGRSLDAISEEIANNGLHFLYKGYSWWTSTSNYATVYQARFVNTPGGVNANMQTKNPYTDQKVQMIYKNQPQKDVEFDVRNERYVVNLPFFGDTSPRYILRYATGEELSSTGKYSDVHEPIPGVEDVYRYYRDVVPVEDLAGHEPEITSIRIVNDRKKQNMTNFTGTAHYKTGSVYKDDADNLWFVVNMAGANDIYRDMCEPSPFSELVSFSGLSRMQSSRYVAGLPTYEQAARATLALHTLIINGIPEIFGSEKKMEELGVSPALARFILENAHVDISRLFQLVKPFSNVPRNYTHMTGFAYSDPAVNTTGQAVGRYLYLIDLSNANPPRYFWKHYPSNPSAAAQTYDSFSTETIFLQDVADAQKVAKYGPDLCATKGFHPAQATHGQTEEDRPYRTQTEPLAELPESYIYNYNRWQEYNYPTDMWNEPVLMFRADAVYDRGDEYATYTVNGRKLTLVKEFPLDYAVPEAAGDIERKEEVDRVMSSLYAYKLTIWQDRPNMHEDGRQFQYPDWMSIWMRP